MRGSAAAINTPNFAALVASVRRLRAAPRPPALRRRRARAEPRVVHLADRRVVWRDVRL